MHVRNPEVWCLHISLLTVSWGITSEVIVWYVPGFIKFCEQANKLVKEVKKDY